MSIDKGEDKDVLTREIQSWDKFKYALREQNATLFNQMLKECQEGGLQFTKAVNSKGESFSAESLFMLLILQQQKIINSLTQKLSEDDKSYLHSSIQDPKQSTLSDFMTKNHQPLQSRLSLIQVQ